MFEPSDTPRIFGLPPGADFPAELASGIVERMAGHPPEALARVTVLVNTRRMQRRLKALLSEAPARLLPRIALVTDVADLVPALDLPPPVSALRRKLELARLVEALIASDPGLAPIAAKFDLADSLAALLDEMQGEGVAPQVLETLDVSDLSGHWERSLKFLSIAGRYVHESQSQWLDPEARRRRATELLIDLWAKHPPKDPIIVAGSTGSRATTAMIMQAVAGLPQGVVVLPGFDFLAPAEVWRELTDSGSAPLGAQDHPQYRFAAFLKSLETDPLKVEAWRGETFGSHRNPLISLSLRPAPVTDRWLSEGPDLGDLLPRVDGMALIEAAQPRDEALAIAVAIRKAVENGKSAALISPDRILGRRVAAALSRWDIVPDDSAGQPLSLTAPGRFLRQVASLIRAPGDIVELIALLKHPLAHSSGSERGKHLLLTRELEMFLRREKVVSVTKKELLGFRDRRSEDEEPWCDWLIDWLLHAVGAIHPRLAACLDHHVASAEALAAGGHEGSGALWERTAGRDALKAIARIRAESEFVHPMSFGDYVRLFEQVLSGESSRDYENARSDIMIWGTLEARVQGADLVILGGLNEGVWPERPAADPWLNRSLRRQAGLLLPDRQIGLSAHDFQQAAAAREVILSRARRDEDSETLPSRWLGRLTNLLEGLKKQSGPEALKAMRLAGQIYVDLAAAIDLADKSTDPEPRPAPAPLRKLRPRTLSVTEIQTLIRDPYAIYAKHILRLRRLDPLRIEPDARLRGDVFHDIAEAALGPGADFSDAPAALERFLAISREKLDSLHWPGIGALWAGHIESIAERVVTDEILRRQTGFPIAVERKGRFDVPGTEMSIKGKADRIDELNDGRLVIYDYKTGAPPNPKQVRHFDRQLLIEAVMAELGGFEELPAAEVSYVGHIGLGRTPETRLHPLEETTDTDFRTETIKAELARLLNSYDTDSKGYPSRRAMEKVRFEGDYDHLARFGEWDGTMEPVTERLP